MKIGLTGGIASGKSTAADLLNQKGAVVIDADQIGHELMKPSTEVGQKIIDYFGDQILLTNNQIDRQQLGKIIFQDKTAKKKLEKIMHPYIEAELKQRMENALQSNQLVVAEVALLIEADMMDLFDEIWVVYVEEATQLSRLMKRSNYSRKKAQRRIDAQLSLQQKVKYADRVINNNGSQKELEEKIDKIWQEVRAEIEN